MTTWQAMAALERLGYCFEITAGGKIRGTLEGIKPPEASALLEIVRRDRDSAAAYVRERQAGATVAEDGSTYPVFDAVAIGKAIKAGEARLIGKITYHRQADKRHRSMGNPSTDKHPLPYWIPTAKPSVMPCKAACVRWMCCRERTNQRRNRPPERRIRALQAPVGGIHTWLLKIALWDACCVELPRA